MKTKARGEWANFSTTCYACAGALTITNGRIDHHDCREPERPVSLADIRAALENRT
jgi:hypothetical protein